MEILIHIEANSINPVIYTDWQHIYSKKKEVNWQETKFVEIRKYQRGRVREKQSRKIGWNNQPPRIFKQADSKESLS